MNNVACFIGVFLLLGNASAWAFGGVSNYLVHFTGYQPESLGSEEFCEDIPSTGPAIIVMDFVDPQLRKMDTALRIVQTDSWSEAKAYALGDESKEIAHLPPQKYQSGSISGGAGGGNQLAVLFAAVAISFLESLRSWRRGSRSGDLMN